MPLAGIVLFAVLLGSPFDRATQPAEPAQSAAVISSVDQAGRVPAQSQHLYQSSDEKVTAPDFVVCYKIRAYIFKRDDDHAPEFVRSTTCGPKAPRVDNATWPDPKIVPLQ